MRGGGGGGVQGRWGRPNTNGLQGFAGHPVLNLWRPCKSLWCVTVQDLPGNVQKLPYCTGKCTSPKQGKDARCAEPAHLSELELQFEQQLYAVFVKPHAQLHHVLEGPLRTIVKDTQV